VKLCFSRSNARGPIPPPSRFALRGEAGFSLIEVSVVVFIISLLAALAVPALKSVQREARSTAVLNDLRVFSAAFQAYAHDRGDWPAGTGVPGEVPPGMGPYLTSAAWSQRTPIGGSYTWAPNSLQQGERYRAAFVISNVGENKVTAQLQQLVDLDRKLDDGDLDTGNFRLGYRNQPVYVLEH
jgi:prepilin-type N-terminal cleavage/methylation domain-containing protein